MHTKCMFIIINYYNKLFSISNAIFKYKNIFSCNGRGFSNCEILKMYRSVILKVKVSDVICKETINNICN